MNELLIFLMGIVVGVIWYDIFKCIIDKPKPKRREKGNASIRTKDYWRVKFEDTYYCFDTEPEADEFCKVIMRASSEVDSLCNTLGVALDSDNDEEDERGQEK